MDICILGVFVLLLHLYICWYHIDGGDDYKDEGSSESEDG